MDEFLHDEFEFMQGIPDDEETEEETPEEEETEDEEEMGDEEEM